MATPLPFDRPYHSPLFRPVCAELAGVFAGLPFAAPRTTVYSCATARPYPGDPDGIRRLANAQWAMPVRFRELVEAMYRDGVRVFVEAGPRGTLLTHSNVR